MQRASKIIFNHNFFFFEKHIFNYVINNKNFNIQVSFNYGSHAFRSSIHGPPLWCDGQILLTVYSSSFFFFSFLRQDKDQSGGKPDCKTRPSLSNKSQVGWMRWVEISKEEKNDANDNKQGNEPSHQFTLCLQQPRQEIMA